MTGRRRRTSLIRSLGFLLAGLCSGASLAAEASTPQPPRLFVLVVFDQMRGDYLNRWEPHFGKGGLRRLMQDGAWYQNCHYPYAGTLTGAGHASLLTGCVPAQHGIVANEWHDRLTGRSINCVSSLRYARVPLADDSGGKGGRSTEPGSVSPELLKAAFCNWLSAEEQLAPAYRRDDRGEWTPAPDGAGYRLPTEAEWEYACRAGTTTHYSFGDDVADLDAHAWFNRTAETKERSGAREVATKRPNPFGLYDMHGNAWERCQYFHDPNWYQQSPATDPQGPATGVNRVVRGAGWHYFDLHCRSAYRNNYAPWSRTANTGLRVVRPVLPRGPE